MDSINVVKIRQNMLLSLYTKWSFALYLVSEIFFPYTIISQAAMLFLSGMVILLCMTHTKMYFHSFFLFTLFLILQSYFFSYNGISINSETSIAMSNTIAINFLFALILYNFILINDNLEAGLFLFARIGLLFSTVIVLLSLGDLFNGRLGWDINFTILGSAVSYNSNTIALTAGFSYLIYLYKLNISKNKLIFPLMLWLVLIIILTGSRKGLLLLIMGTPMLVFLLDPKKRTRNILVGSTSIIILYLIIMYVPVFYNIAGYRVEALLNMFLGKEAEEASASTRDLYIERGWEYFLAKPWTGYGLDNFRNLNGSYGSYSHNNYIELLVSGGIPTFIFYYIIRIIILLKLFINRNLAKVNKLLFIVLLFLFIAEYGLVSYFDRIYMLLFIFALSGYSTKKEGKILKTKLV